MMTENDVVDAVCVELARRGWAVRARSHTTEHGVDVVAVRAGETIHIEAKGEGSSKEGTRRFGQQFTRNQVRSHVAVAVLTALGVVANASCRAGVAVPDNDHHRVFLGAVSGPLGKLGVVIFWVSPDSVRVEPSSGV